jgi:hypothetical protein
MIYAKTRFDSTLFGIDYFTVELWSEGKDGEPDKMVKYPVRLPEEGVASYLRREL